MAAESSKFKTALNRFLPFKLFWILIEWKSIYAYMINCGTSYGLFLDRGYKLLIWTPESGHVKSIKELNFYDYNNWVRYKSTILESLEILADPKKTIDRFIKNNWLKLE